MTADYDRLVAAGARARLDSTVGLLRGLAVTGGGGLAAARRHRVAAIAAAEELGDPVLTARVIGAYDVPAIWTRSDDPAQAAAIVAAAERTLAALPIDSVAARARLLATIAVESRGTRDPRPRQCALEAERLARGLDDPGLLAFALNGVFMQSCHRTGLAPERDAIGAELVELAATHGLVTAEVLGHLIRLQARSALGDFSTADTHAEAADRLAARHELPLVAVFTTWYRALRRAAHPDAAQPTTQHEPTRQATHTETAQQATQDEAAQQAAHPQAPRRTAQPDVSQQPPQTAQPGASRQATHPTTLQDVAAAYEQAAKQLDGAGMPGLEDGLLPLALLCLHIGRGEPAPTTHADYGPYEPWTRPLVLLARGDVIRARAALRAAPEPPADLLAEALWCLLGTAAAALGERATVERARQALTPARDEIAGAGSGLLTAGPVAAHLATLEAPPAAASGRQQRKRG